MDFDAIVFGTGLSESIAAAALSKAGFKVAHVDTNDYYGGDEASLTLNELAEWADARSSSEDASTLPDYLVKQRARYWSVSRSQSLPPEPRQYSVALSPSIIPSIGPHIDALIASGVSRYGSFKLLERVAVYDRPGFVQTVPGNKEDVFKSKELSLIDKRRLMRFLMFAAGDFEGKQELEGKEQMPFLQFVKEVFSLNDKAASAIAYALAFCTSPEDPTLPAIQRIRQHLRSAGRYGTSPFLVGHYGGTGETAQGFCRASAVKGGTYILGRRVVSVIPPSSTPDNLPKDEQVLSTSADTSPSYSVELGDFTEQLTAKVLVSSPDYVPASFQVTETPVGPSASHAVARCIAIIDKPLVFTPSDAAEENSPIDFEEPAEGADEETPERLGAPDYEVDTALLVFPPESLASGSSTMAAHALVTGESSMSAPKGKYILNISLPLRSASSSTAKELLKPYLDATLTLTIPPSAPPETYPTAPLFTLFFIYRPAVSKSSAGSKVVPNLIIAPPPTPLLPALADEATQNAEAIFWEAVKQFKSAGVRSALPKESTTEEGCAKGEQTGSGGNEEIDAFWPPLEAAEVEAMDEW